MKLPISVAASAVPPDVIETSVSGTVAEINEELLDAPQLINEAAYDAWFIKVENVTDKAELLTAEEYTAFVESL